MDDRGQAFTLEAVVAALLIVSAVAFSLQIMAITSNTASVGDTELRDQHAGIAQGLLDGAADRGTLKNTLLSWNEKQERFHNATDEDGFYLAEPPDTTFGEDLEEHLASQGLRYNIDLVYLDKAGERQTHQLVEYGTPSADAVRVTQTVTLYEDSHLVHKNGTAHEDASLQTVNDTFYAPNIDEESTVYTVIRVEVTVW